MPEQDTKEPDPGVTAGAARGENHRFSLRIVVTAAEHGGVPNIEKLLGIRDRTKKTQEVSRMLYASGLPSSSYSSCTRQHQPTVQPLPTYGEGKPAQAALRCKACG